MDIIFKKRIIEYINRKDPQKEIISEIAPNKDFSGGKIAYNKDNLTLHRGISILTNEEYIRAYLVVKLVRELKYLSLRIELEKEYEAGRPKTIKPRIDILVKDKRKKTFLFIEVKSPDKYESDKGYIEGQLFRLAKLEGGPENVKYLVYYSSKFSDGNLEDQPIIIDYPANPNFQEWSYSGNVSLDSLPIEYGIARKAIYANKTEGDLLSGEKTLDRKVKRERFNYLRKDLHNVLWGGGGMFYNEIFSNLVKLFLAKIYDEETTAYGNAYSFQIVFKNGTPESPLEIYQKINKLFKESQKVYLGYSNELVEHSVGIDREKISENKIAYVVEQFQEISILENENIDDGDLLGEFFEGIVSEGFKQDKGQFFTHPNLVQFIIHALDIDNLAIDLVTGKENPAKPRLPFICDPACGSGTFLIESMKLITKTIKNSPKIARSVVVQRFLASNFPGLKENTWAREHIYGIEINSDLALATKVNMVLHGDGSINIFAKDGLLSVNHYELPNKISILSKSEIKRNFSYSYEVNEAFDVVISNPPFSVTLDTETKRTLPERFMYADKRNSENLFMERWYQLLKENGRLGVVLPESVFDTSENIYIRMFIYKYFNINAIVSLPGGKDGAFRPYAGTKTSLLFAQKKSKDEVEKYEATWRKYSNEYQRLKRQIAGYRKGELKSENVVKEDIKRYLKTFFDDADNILSAKKILSKYRNEISEVNKNRDWWVFGEVAIGLDYSILMADAREIGYKRTLRGEQRRPNELFQISEGGEITIDRDNPKTILDWIKSPKNPSTLNIFTIKFSDLMESFGLRLDVRFHKYINFELLELLNSFKKPAYPFRNVIKSIRNGKDIKRDYYSDTDTEYTYITVNNIKPEGIVLDDVVFIENEKGHELEKYRLKRGDIIITRSGTVGVCKVFGLSDNLIYIPSGYLIIVEIDENEVRGKFIEYFLNSKLMRTYFDVFGTGKTQKNIAQPDIRRIPIPDLTIKDQEEIIKSLEPIRKHIKEKREEIEVLKGQIEKSFTGAVLK